MPPIHLIEIAPPYVSVGAEAFVQSGTIYLITSSGVFQEAASAPDKCRDSMVVRKLASILAHEEWHVRHGSDEKAAYEHQLVTLIRLGVTPGSALFNAVQRSMLLILDARKRNQPERMIARR